jgi:signal transduction histidine kinase
VLERSNGEVERIGRLVKNMLVFSRIKPSGSDDQSNITATLKKVLALLQADYRRLEINCSIEVPDDIHVRCNEDSLQQILLNLLMNARDALATSLPPRKIAIEGRREGSYVVLSVSDSGPGVPEDKRSRIFDPFFTTKPPGQGTGLGLAVSRQAVDAAGGEIELDKGYGRGARFVVRFEAA